MAQIHPFAALRYNTDKVGLHDVVTQPYDKITPQMQERYYAASPYNLVRIILGKPEGEETEANNRYTQAADHLRGWRQTGVLTKDGAPSIYAYSQTFQVGDDAVERRGFIATGQLYDYDQRVVFRHEQTLAKPKSDRLNLLRATRTHFGQIFMLYSDPALTIDSLLFDDPRYAWLEVKDEYGVLHRMRRISEHAILNIIQTEMADKKLIIADGHHRYETALNFRRELTPGADPTIRANAERVMMTFVNMDSPGLVILPTHRVIFGVEGFDPAGFLVKSQELYEVSKIESENARELTQKLAEAGSKGSAFVAALKTGNYLLQSKPGSLDRIPAQFSARQRKLDVVNLHSLLLDQILGISAEKVTDQQHVRYLRDAGEAMAQVQQDPDVNVAFLMNPVSIEQVREVAFAGEVLPQKSTDFYPKLLSGLTTFSLAD